MFFVLKSIFWLGLVFIIAPSTGAHDPQRRDAGRIAAQATAEAAGAIAAAVPAVALEVCKQAPKECLNGAMGLRAGERRSKAQSAVKPVSADTLTGADRAPGWRGQKTAQRQI